MAVVPPTPPLPPAPPVAARIRGHGRAASSATAATGRLAAGSGRGITAFAAGATTTIATPRDADRGAEQQCTQQPD
jgi:hypothetical protein